MNTLHIQRKVYEDAFWKSTSGSALVLKLLVVFDTDEELASRSFKGGMTVSKTGAPVEKISLDRDAKFQAILSQVEKEFPGSMRNSEFRQIRENVNAKCRKIADRLS